MPTSRLSAFASAAFWLALPACSDDSAVPPNVTQDASIDAPSPPQPDAGGDADADADAGARTSSPLLVSSNVVRGPSGTVGDTNLIFFNAGEPPCPYKKIGECHTWACGERDSKAVLLDAGEISLKGGSSDLAITRLSDGTYSVDRSVGTEAWPLGASLTIAGAGGADVPAFQKVLTAPAAELTLTTQDAGAGLWTADVVSSAGFTVGWSAPTSGKVGVGITTTVAAPSAVDAKRLYCVFDASATTATVPGEALAVLGNVTTATALVSAETSDEVKAGPYTILVRTGRTRRIDITFK